MRLSRRLSAMGVISSGVISSAMALALLPPALAADPPPPAPAATPAASSAPGSTANSAAPAPNPPDTAPGASTSQGSTLPAASPGAGQPASAPSTIALADRVQLYKQINALALTPAQLQDIFRRLAGLDQANTAHIQRQNEAVRLVLPQMQRMQQALLTGKAPDPKDQDQVEAALAPLRAESKQIEQMRKDIISVIRQELSRTQMDAVRIDLGLDPLGDTSGGAQGAGPGGAGPGGAGPGGAGPGGPAGGNPGGGTAAADPAGAGGTGGTDTAAADPSTAAPSADPTAGGPNGGQNPGQNGRGFGRNRNPQQFIGAGLDRLRSMPPDQFDQFKDRMATMFARRMGGGDPNSPDFAAAKANYLNQLEQIRQMPDSQYQTTRAQLVSQISQQFQANGGGRRQRAADQDKAASDDEAIRRFFLQPEVVPYLRTKFGR